MRVNNVRIVGGGPGGLMSAYFLEKMADAPVRVTVFEAADRLGGRVFGVLLCDPESTHPNRRYGIEGWMRWLCD